MKLLTAEIKKRLPKLGSQDSKSADQVQIVVKWFHPTSGWAWYATEGEQQEDGGWLFFGLVRGFENELGYFSLADLESARGGPLNLGVERDMHFGRHTLAEAQEKQI